MKKLSQIIALLSVFALPSFSSADEKGEVVRVLVPSMSCVGCSSSVTDSLKKMPGVSKVSVNLKHKVALIQSSKKMDDTKIEAAVKDAGYEATKIERSKLSYKEAKAKLEEKTS